MKVAYLLLIFLAFALLFGCTERDDLIFPYTTSQFVSASTDLNYQLFVDGYYDGNYLFLNNGKLSISPFDANAVPVDWNAITGFPVGCGVGEAVQIIGSTLTCVSVGGVDTNFETAGYDFGDYVPYVGATTDVDLGANDLTVGGRTVLGIDQADLGFMTSKVKIVANTTGVSGVQMGNIGSGSSTDFRFILKDSTDHYFAFMQAGTSNIRTIWDYNRKDYDIIFNHGGTSRHMIIGTSNDKDLAFIQGGNVKLRLDTGGSSISMPEDNLALVQGAGNDYSQYFDGTNQNFELTSGDFVFDNNVLVRDDLNVEGNFYNTMPHLFGIADTTQALITVGEWQAIDFNFLKGYAYGFSPQDSNCLIVEQTGHYKIDMEVFFQDNSPVTTSRVALRITKNHSEIEGSYAEVDFIKQYGVLELSTFVMEKAEANDVLCMEWTGSDANISLYNPNSYSDSPLVAKGFISWIHPYTPEEEEEEASQAVNWMTGYDTHNVYEYDESWEYTGTNYSLVDLVNANGQVYWGNFACRDITQDSDGNWYVVDNVYDDVWKFYNNWTYTGEHYDLTSQETNPEGIAFGNDGYLYAVGWSSDTVFKYSSDGVYTGTSYDISAQSNYPTGIYQDLEGYWWVLDSFVDKVFKYNSNWVYTGTSYTTKFGSPIVKGANGYGMFQDSEGYWYITDIADDAVNQYDSSWAYAGSSWAQSEDDVMTGIIGED